MRKLLFISIHLIAFFLTNVSSPAIESGSCEETAEPEFKTVTSMEAFGSVGSQTGNSLSLAADYALNHGEVDRALKLCKLALDKDYDNLEIHNSYAKALQEKLNSQKKRDPYLYNECVKEWLIVYRTEVGPEKSSIHGISPFGHLYDDEDLSIPAKNRLIKLTGRAPKAWETDAKYLKWVNRPTTSVAGKVVSKNK